MLNKSALSIVSFITLLGFTSASLAQRVGLPVDPVGYRSFLLSDR